MTPRVPAFNGAKPPVPDISLPQIRSLISGGRYWLFASDHSAVRLVFKGVAGQLRTDGAPADSVYAVDVICTHLPSARQTTATLLAVGKTIFSVRDAIDFVGSRVAPDIARGRDCFIVGSCPDELIELMCDISGGRCSVIDPSAN